MRIRERAPRFGAALVLLTTGCAAAMTLHPPEGWLPTFAEEREHRAGYGAWCLLQGKRLRVEGELIAVRPDTTFVLGVRGLEAIPTASISMGSFATHREETGSTALTHVDAESWPDMARFARFPQGIPAGVDRRTLLPKP